ncbi:MAG TPA: PaaI family thioesterase [Acidimicrobiales bacterium]|nr:PaaI family thioesterase [Acidimicrobiales bacterium]
MRDMTAARTSGLEFMRALAAGSVPAPPLAGLIGMAPVEVEAGRVVFALEPGEHLYNPIGSVHGGIIATLLDSAMGCAVHTTLEAGTGYTTIALNVQFVGRLLADTGEVRAEGTVVTSGRRTATAEGRLVDRTGRILAHATTTCLLFEVPTEAERPS